MNYQLSAPDAWTPTGVDGRGHNRLTLYPPSPLARCLWQPQNWQAAWELHHRPAQASPLSFGACTYSGGCDTCPIANAKRHEYHPGTQQLGVVREFTDGSVWILNRRDKGWGEFGYRYNNWAEFVQNENVVIGERKIDEHGAYFEVLPC